MIEDNIRYIRLPASITQVHNNLTNILKKTKADLRENIRLRKAVDRLLNHDSIKKVQEKPLVLEWLCDTCDPCDPCDRDRDQDHNKGQIQDQSQSRSQGLKQL